MNRQGPTFRPPPGLRRTRRQRCVILPLAIAYCLAAPVAAPAITIVTYNILRYDGTSTCARDREPALRFVLAAIDADIVCVQEIQGGLSGADNFRDRVLNHPDGPGNYLRAPFTNGPDSDNALYYRGDRINVEAHVAIPTGPLGVRDWSYYAVRLVDLNDPTELSRLHLFIGHLKAGSSQSDKDRRAAEADTLRDWAEQNLPLGAHVIVCGDFNLQNASEPAWTAFTETRPTNIARLRDPSGRAGNWHLNSSFADIHTQSPQAFNGQSACSSNCTYAGGALDDRFDFLLTSDSLHDQLHVEYLDGSNRPFGNDGAHFNIAINAPPVIPEGQAMADALECASDHLPVLLQIAAPPTIDSPTLLNTFGPVIVGAVGQADLVVANASPPPAQTLIYQFLTPAPFAGPTGPFNAPPGAPAATHRFTMHAATPGDHTGNLIIQNNSLNDPDRQVLLAGRVKDHGKPSTDPVAQVLTASVDFGTHPPGGFLDRVVAIHDPGFNAFQSLVEIHAATVTGDERFRLLSFSPAVATFQPAEYDVQFDDGGAVPGTHTGTIVFSTRDQSNLPGATDLEPVTFNLTATVTGQFLRGDLDRNGVVDPPDIPLLVAVLLDPAAASGDDRIIADMNADTLNDALDLPPFVDSLLGP